MLLLQVVPLPSKHGHPCENVARWRGYSQEMQSAMSRALLFMEAPYLILHVRRDHILSDSLNILSSVDSHRLKMPLKVWLLPVIGNPRPSPLCGHRPLPLALQVIFDGEEGVDQGGVAKEFFQILVRKIFDVNFGMRGRSCVGQCGRLDG